MRTIQNIYDEYRIPPWLQEHQLRVAAVAEYMCGLQAPIDSEIVVCTALLHDIGAIVKFDLESPVLRLREELSAEELLKWKKVQEEFRAKYGTKEYNATNAILTELSVPEIVRTYFNGMGFYRAEEILARGSTQVQILEYADVRVSPQGIVSMEERLAEGRKRYAAVAAYFSDEEEYQKRLSALQKMERNLFAGQTVRPEDITDALLAARIDALRATPIPTTAPAL